LLQCELADAMLAGKPAPQSAADNLKTLVATFATYNAAQSHT